MLSVDENDAGTRVNVAMQAMVAGGKLRSSESPNGCHSWRSEMRHMLILDGFYEPAEKEAFEFVKEWTDENDCFAWTLENAEVHRYSDFDRRWLAFSFGKKNDPDGGAVLDTVWDKYYDSKEKYDKLVAIKNKFDENYLFTANTFGIDATGAQQGKQVQIRIKEKWTKEPPGSDEAGHRDTSADSQGVSHF